jgi:type II secretory pathway pseudopilin PulG
MKKTTGKVSRGFALIVTLTLMILLTVIAVGLLTLSSISLRASAQTESMATARSNARLAMMMALGELQRTAGPDQRVTAPANLLAASASPAITGVWESWKPDPAGGNDYVARKTTVQTTPDQADGEFITWLASGNPASPAGPSTPPGVASSSPAHVTLVSERQNGTVSQRGAHLTPVRLTTKGEYAWTVLDEGAKARVNLATEASITNLDERYSRLRAPARPQVEAIGENLSGLPMDSSTGTKVTSLEQAEVHLGKRAELRPSLHDLTASSVSLPVNVADGGIKADLTRAFEQSALPSDLVGRFVYSNTKSKLTASDPLFSTLAGFYQVYKKAGAILQTAVPNRYTPYTGTTPNLTAVDGTLLAPVVTRVSVAFSLVSREAHGNWKQSILNATGDNLRTSMVYLIYTPVVTVYNPYSKPIQFRNLNVTFRNIPVAFKFFRNGQAQTNKPTLLSSFHILSENSDWEDPFSCTASNREASAADTLITLYPGEARVFGSSQPSTGTWGSMTNYLWSANDSLANSKTAKNVFAGAGWDYRAGYIVDWLRPAIGERTTDNKNLGVFGVRPTDTVNVEVSPLMPGKSGGKFSVDFNATVGNRANTALGIYEFRYGTQAKLDEILANGNHTTIGKITYPFRRERDFTVSELNLPNAENVQLKNWGSAPKQFAIFTIGARTANDSLYPGKPGRTSSFVHHVLQMDATRSHPALLPLEMSLLPVTVSGANTVGSIDADDVNRAFYFSGTTRGSGAIHYVTQNLPQSPLMNLADLRHANLTSSGHLPLIQHTVGESLASPVVAPDRARSTSSFGYEVVDSAWLANQTLWDGFYFSGVRNASDAGLVFAGKPLPLNPRQTPLLTQMDSKAAVALTTSNTGWADSASLMGVKGGFNVNSTSVNAWKAVLSSLRGLEIPVLGPAVITDPSGSPVNYTEKWTKAGAAAFPRVNRPISGSVNASNSADNQLRWSGYRELSTQEIDTLAQSIVQEVRARGPFLSMAEFVNRRLGSASDDMAARGALEEAIRKSDINKIPMGPVNRIITEEEASSFGYANPKAAAGNTEEGASAILTQGDLLSAIGAAVTVRSDTFVIRSYGAARDGTRVTARAWCEATIQRIPSFVDPTDAPEKVQAAILTNGRKITDLSEVNQRFGRRFSVVSFRWLSATEI